jgi:hypothetical protein
MGRRGGRPRGRQVEDAPTAASARRRPTLGICFEYAVHDAVQRADQTVAERVYGALRLCRVPGDNLTSLLFGAEKTGSQQIIATAHDVLTDESALLYGARARPVKLKTHVSDIAEAFAIRQRGLDSRRA